MDGWCGKILRVDLSRNESHIESLDQSVLEQFLGGRGLEAYFCILKYLRRPILSDRKISWRSAPGL